MCFAANCGNGNASNVPASSVIVPSPTGVTVAPSRTTKPATSRMSSPVTARTISQIFFIRKNSYIRIQRRQLIFANQAVRGPLQSPEGVLTINLVLSNQLNEFIQSKRLLETGTKSLSHFALSLILHPHVLVHLLFRENGTQLC